MKMLSGAATLAATLLSTSALAVPPSSCSLGNGIKHVVYLQFDNTHFARDNASVPSDLEQMPHLLSFVQQNGFVLSNDHTQLISHTANGLLTSQTGVYPDRLGAGAIANSFNFYYPPTGKANYYNSSFVYWTDLVNDSRAGGDQTYVLLAANGQNAPAPWVPYTRAGCDVAALGIADIDLENTTTDLATTYGTNSPEYALAQSNYDQGLADFEGIALHCAQNSAICAAANSLASVEADGLPVSKAVADVLPQEPNGYSGFQAIFGHRYLAPAVQSILGQPTNGQLYDYQGNLIGYQTAVGGQIIQADTISGFPGFDGMFPFVTLSYAETMLKAGVPVLFGYFSDAHDHHYGTQDGVNPAGTDFGYGPGEQGYVNQLKQYDAAFAKFFSDLNAAGINQTNTLFVILVEEGDKFAGDKGVPSGCNGVTTPCTYPPTQYTFGNASKGEVDININTLLSTQRNDTTPFYAHTDMATGYYLNGDPSPTNATTRQFEQDVAALTYQDPYFNDATFPVTTALADPAELAVLHQITADPLRTPTFIGYNNDDVYGGIGAVTYGSSNPGCGTSSSNELPVCTYPGYVWNHGGIQSVVRQTWTSMVGPGVKAAGIDSTTWTDHTDVRATMFALLGLQDDYLHDGRVVVEDLLPSAIPSDIANNLQAYEQLATVYKQLNAPFGTASTASLRYATAAIKSTSPHDAIYTNYLSMIGTFTTNRNTLAAQIRTILNAAEQNQGFDVSQVPGLVAQANMLIQQITGLGGSSAH